MQIRFSRSDNPVNPFRSSAIALVFSYKSLASLTKDVTVFFISLTEFLSSVTLSLKDVTASFISLTEFLSSVTDSDTESICALLLAIKPDTESICSLVLLIYAKKSFTADSSGSDIVTSRPSNTSSL